MKWNEIQQNKMSSNKIKQKLIKTKWNITKNMNVLINNQIIEIYLQNHNIDID